MKKCCDKCNTFKELSEFHKLKHSKDGLQHRCKQCKKEYRAQAHVKKHYREYMKEYQQRPGIKEHIRKYKKAYRQTTEGKKAKNAWQMRDRQRPEIRLNRNISNGIRKALKGNKAGHRWESLVGYTLKDLKRYLKRQFEPGMTWENYGEWHVDHKIPISAFNFSGPNDLDFKRCWALKNLQPLWADDNLEKHAMVATPFQPALALSIGSL